MTINFHSSFQIFGRFFAFIFLLKYILHLQIPILRHLLHHAVGLHRRGRVVTQRCIERHGQGCGTIFHPIGVEAIADDHHVRLFGNEDMAKKDEGWYGKIWHIQPVLCGVFFSEIWTQRWTNNIMMRVQPLKTNTLLWNLTSHSLKLGFLTCRWYIFSVSMSNWRALQTYFP